MRKYVITLMLLFTLTGSVSGENFDDYAKSLNPSSIFSADYQTTTGDMMSKENLIGSHEIVSFNTEIEVYTDGVSKVINRLVVDSSDIDTIFSVPAYAPDALIVTDDEGDLKFAVFGKDIIIQPRTKTNDYEVRVQYLTDTLTLKNVDGWSLKYTISAHKKLNAKNIEKQGVIVSLPNTAIITESSESGIIFTEDSQLKIGWNIIPKKEDDTFIEVRYTNKVEQKIDYIKIAFYSLLLVLIMTGLVFSIRSICHKITKRLSRGKKDIMKTLEKRENAVLTILLSNNGKLYQSKIQKDTNISKATLSRIIRRLENKSIIEVVPSGNTNLITAQEWFLKK